MEIYKRILGKFPQNIVFSFAYGSGVKKQLGYDNNLKKAAMVDLVFCVKNTEKWHQENLAINSSHYSAMKLLGSSWIAKYQEKLGANVYCNTLIPLPEEGIMIKYGVISEADLLADLKLWKHLYLAGRLHKPVSIITSTSESIKDALENNLLNALRCALLILPEKFTKFELFHAISNISYKGDFRMVFGENKNKVNNIVKPQVDKFYDLYLPTIDSLSKSIQLTSDADFIQDKSKDVAENHLLQLPKHLVKKIVINSRLKGSEAEILHQISSQDTYPSIVLQSLCQIVFKSSAWQSIKNIPTAGLWKSISYSWEKAVKTFT